MSLCCGLHMTTPIRLIYFTESHGFDPNYIRQIIKISKTFAYLMKSIYKAAPNTT